MPQIVNSCSYATTLRPERLKVQQTSVCCPTYPTTRRRAEKLCFSQSVQKKAAAPLFFTAWEWAAQLRKHGGPVSAKHSFTAQLSHQSRGTRVSTHTNTTALAEIKSTPTRAAVIRRHNPRLSEDDLLRNLVKCVPRGYETPKRPPRIARIAGLTPCHTVSQTPCPVRWFPRHL